MHGLFPVKASASVTTSQITVSSSPSPPTPSSQTLTTPELDQSPLFGSSCSSGSGRRNRRPPPVKIPQYAHYPQPNNSSKLDYSRQSIVSTFSDGASSDEEDIPIYFGGLPAHLSARRPSPGIPMDATYEQGGFLSSRSNSFGRRSSSFGNCLLTSPLPKLTANSDQAESYCHPLDHHGYTAEVNLIKGFYGPFNPFASSAPATSKVDPFIAVTPPVENIGIGLGLHSPQRRQQPKDIMSISLDKGVSKTIRAIQPGGLSVPASLQTSKLRKEIGGIGHARSGSVDSTFTISAYEGLPSDTPHQQSVSRFEYHLGDDRKMLARHHMLLTDPVSPKTMSSDPSHTTRDPRTTRDAGPDSSSPPSSTHAEAGFFLSQMDSYLAKHTEPHHPFRAPLPKEPSFGSYQDLATARSLKPTLMLDTSCLVPTKHKQAQSAVEATNRRINHLRDRSLSGGAGLTPVRKSIDQNTTIQLSIDQESFRKVTPIFKYTRTRTAKAFQARPNGRPHTAGSVRDTGKQPFSERGCIEFRMEKKELWPYHYSALEPLPTLRRIWVNGDTTCNHNRRNASLGMRKNGVYQVYGTHERGEVEWKFEYVVEDRRSETSGKVISGERVIMPLTFSCTPDFLDEAQTGLIDKVRRKVTPPVNSHRVPPPSLSATSSDQSPSRNGLKTPLFSFSRTDSSHSTDQTSPSSRDSPQDGTRPLRSKISASLLPFGGRTKRPSTAQPRMPCSSPLSPLASSVSVGSIDPSRSRLDRP